MSIEQAAPERFKGWQIDRAASGLLCEQAIRRRPRASLGLLKLMGHPREPPANCSGSWWPTKPLRLSTGDALLVSQHDAFEDGRQGRFPLRVAAISRRLWHRRDVRSPAQNRNRRSRRAADH
jgi:hypothetical protein